MFQSISAPANFKTSSRKDYKARHSSYASFQSVHSASEFDEMRLTHGESRASMPGTPHKHSLTRHLSELEKQKLQDEDLKHWMERQQVREAAGKIRQQQVRQQGRETSDETAGESQLFCKSTT